ncbi:hypothetical protein RclHR1_13180002 [Rhizophagus clarus]|uniref:Glycoside hydrolase family 20 protein n=1 Tax=Rhizophagus clarus TaxID=94130 RepID=A0A2Z6QLS9_9GLOM|nr:hypothetical protein RclHR1_13180002 [Rhizophagus clarus]GET03535.1 glycoside hydrolase family 20 protein [Rhizophagus clarus]
MIYSGFSLQILVNNKPLKECDEHVNKRIVTTGPSYVLDEKTGRKIKSDKTFYAAVEELGTNYVVQFGASSNHFSSSSCTTLKAKLFIDGKWDHTCKQIQKATLKSRKDGFFDEQRQKHLFRFDVTNWLDDNKEDIKNNIKYSGTRSIYGGIGAISVYFYVAEEVERLNNYTKNKVEKVQVPESTGIGMGIKISTGFQKSQDVKMVSNKMLKSTSTIPIAVLHIHYRPACWLRIRNILLDYIPLKIEKKVIEGEFEAIKTEEKKIKVKREFSEFFETEESKQDVEKKIKIEHQI